MKNNKIFKNIIITVLIVFSLLITVSCSKSDSDEIDKSTRPDLYTYVPDDKFEQLLINQGYDDSLDDYVLTDNIINVKSLLNTSSYFVGFEARSSEISDFTGIEDFINLVSFNCSGLNLTQLNLSNNVSLKVLYCDSNNLTSLDLSNLMSLEILECSNNNLSSLKLNSASLVSLSCNENSLLELDISTTNNLRDLTCFRNNLTSLDIGKNVNLKSLNVSSNLFTNIDISNNNNLTDMNCFSNPMLTCIQVNEEQLLNDDWAFCSKNLFSLNCD